MTDVSFSRDWDADARDRDAADPLKAFRRRFYVPDATIYMDGNSLGLLSPAAGVAIHCRPQEHRQRGALQRRHVQRRHQLRAHRDRMPGRRVQVRLRHPAGPERKEPGADGQGAGQADDVA